MATAYTSLLGLALPVQGELQGTWGDTVNNSITSLLDTAVAGTTTLSSDADVTLTTTTGASNQARQAIILWTASGTVTRNITAPAQSKIYTVINKTGSTQSIVLRGVGPTTGVTIPAGAAGTFAWNGTDFVDISNYVSGNKIINGNLTVNGNTTLGDAAGDTITVNGATTFANVNPTLSAGTANGVGYLNGSKVLTTGSALTFDGTTLTANALSVTNGVTLSAGTANGVLYLNGSKVATSGSALTFDGTTFATTARTSSANGAWVGSGAVMGWGAAGTFSNYIVGDTTSNYLLFQVNSAEGMRLTSTGLGIGTSSPGRPLDVIRGTAGFVSSMGFSSGVSIYQYTDANAAYISTATNLYNAFGINETSSYLNFYTANAERMRIDSSGNLGLGVTPSTYNVGRAVEVGAVGNSFWTTSNDVYLTANTFYQSGYKYAASTYASIYEQTSGAHKWFTAPSGTAGNTISFTQVMMLDASGNLGIGTSLPAAKLDVRGASTDIGFRYIETSTGDANRVELGAIAGLGYINATAGVGQPGLALQVNSLTRATLDSSGNLGLGVTPSAWGGSYKAIELPGISVANLNGGTNQQAQYLLNAYDSGAGAWKYKITGVSAAMYRQAADASHEWHLAPSGTAGNAITFTQAMTLDASGRLLVGTTTGGIGNNANTVLTVGGTNVTTYQSIKSSGGEELIFLVGAGETAIGTYTNNYLAFRTNNSERVRITSAGNFGIGTTNPTSALSVVGAGSFTAGLNVGSGTSASEVAIEVGAGRTGNGYAYIDLIGDATYTDYGLRIIRGNSGANADSELLHRGTGIFNIEATDSAPITFSTANTERARITSGGDLQSYGAVSIWPSSSGGAGSYSIIRAATNALAITDDFAGQERLRITSGGNLLVGLTSDSSYGALQVNAGSNRFFEVGGSGATRLRLSSTDAGYLIGYRFSQNNGTEIASIEAGGNATSGNSVTDNFIKFNNLGTERARITSGGYFKASNSGTYDSSTGTYHEFISSTDNASTIYIRNNATNGTQYGPAIVTNNDQNDATRYFLSCYGGATERATIRSNGGIANYQGNDVNLSDRREKTNFAPAKSYLDTICAIPVQTFDYINQSPDDPGLTLGVVAQDVQAVAPELVTESNWGTKEEPKMRLSIYQTDLQYALMKCIQEQQALITQLTARVAQLESK